MHLIDVFSSLERPPANCCIVVLRTWVFSDFVPRYYVMRNHVVEKVLKLIRRKEKYLVVAAVRFLRTCVASKVGFVGSMSCLVHSKCFY